MLEVQCGDEVMPLMRISADQLPTVEFFTVDRDTVAAGKPVRLSWALRNVEFGLLEVTPGIGTVSPMGSVEVVPLRSTTYVLKWSEPGVKAVSRTVTVTVRRESSIGGEGVAFVRRGGGGRRRGRGFSPGELACAGLALVDAKKGAFRVDRRRKTTHASNVDQLRWLQRG